MVSPTIRNPYYIFVLNIKIRPNCRRVAHASSTSRCRHTWKILPYGCVSPETNLETSPCIDPDAAVAYTESINLLDYSAVVIPVTKADKSIDMFDSSYEPSNDVDRKNWEACESNFNRINLLPCFDSLIKELSRCSRNLRWCTGRAPNCSTEVGRRESVGSS